MYCSCFEILSNDNINYNVIFEKKSNYEISPFFDCEIFLTSSVTSLKELKYEVDYKLHLKRKVGVMSHQGSLGGVRCQRYHKS